MKKILLIFIILHLSNSMVFSQFIDDKLNLSFSAGINRCIGKKNIIEEGFSSPSLFNNFKKGFNFKINASYKFIPYVRITAQLKSNSFNGWNNGENATLYKNSKSIIKSIGVGLILQQKFSSTGIFNKLSASVIFMPTYNNVKVKLKQSVYEIQQLNEQIDLLNSQISSIGVDLNFNVQYSINQKYAFFAESCVSYINLESQLYNDKNLVMFGVNIGFCMKFMKDKHFYYH